MVALLQLWAGVYRLRVIMWMHRCLLAVKLLRREGQAAVAEASARDCSAISSCLALIDHSIFIQIGLVLWLGVRRRCQSLYGSETRLLYTCWIKILAKNLY